MLKWDCVECGAGKAKRRDSEIDLWNSRGRCGGDFQPGKKLRPLQDDRGYYLTPLSLAHDAAAPCFEPEERFYTCPVAIAGSEFAIAAYRWHGCFSKPARREFLPERISALVEEAVYAVDQALASREEYELRKNRKPG